MRPYAAKQHSPQRTTLCAGTRRDADRNPARASAEAVEIRAPPAVFRPRD